MSSKHARVIQISAMMATDEAEGTSALGLLLAVMMLERYDGRR